MKLRALLRSPLFWILLVAGGLRLGGIFWGLPASDGWDDDGFAPRNFLTALALTYSHGSYFTYPPLHAFILALLTWPGIVWALLHAHSLAQGDVVQAFIQVPTMTFFAVVARLVSIVMSLGIAACVARMTALIANQRAGLLAAAVSGLSVVLTYYGQVTNLDVPYLFWCALSLLCVMQAIARHQPKRFWGAALSAAAAIATKDQAYAIFLISIPAVLLLWFGADAWPRRHARAVLPVLLFCACLAVFCLLLVDGAITNPAGFARRIAFLTGPASQDYAAYQHNMAGRLRLLEDMGAYYAAGIGWAAGLLAALGIGLHAARFRDKAAWVAGWLPLLAMISFTVCFNFAALRSDERFLLPQTLFAAIYIGIAIEWAIGASASWARTGVRLLLAAGGLYALYQCACVEAAFVNDPRYDAEQWMAGHIKPGVTVETYGQNAYLPRFPAGAMITRVGETPLNRRNPLPQVIEIQEPFLSPRDPQFIVVSGWWVENYLRPPESGNGRIIPKVEWDRLQDSGARQYFSRLESGQLNYRLAHVSDYTGGFWRPFHIHESLGETIQIFARN